MVDESITQLLLDASAGNQDAVDALFPIVYAEMRRLSTSYLRKERPGHTLQSTALVHEAYLRLIDQKVNWQSRAHFMGIAAQTMRRILLDHAKRKAAGKRGGGDIAIEFDESSIGGKVRDLNLIALDEALLELEKIDPIRSRIVEMRFFGGLSNEESAEVLGISTATVQRQWAGARAWLFHTMKKE
jgi:RNA polymerase sigma factor (TIGR02999 family)